MEDITNGNRENLRQKIREIIANTNFELAMWDDSADAIIELLREAGVPQSKSGTPEEIIEKHAHEILDSGEFITLTDVRQGIGSALFDVLNQLVTELNAMQEKTEKDGRRNPYSGFYSGREQAENDVLEMLEKLRDKFQWYKSNVSVEDIKGEGG